MLQPSFLVLDKPVGLTSHDCVDVVRRVIGDRRVGHTGTLDPFASGVLLIALGPATRLISFLEDDLKVYLCAVRLGISTVTGDPEGEEAERAPVPPLEAAQVQAVLREMEGEQPQRAHLYSAVKVKGRRLYDYARAGEAVEAPIRTIRVDTAELVSLNADLLQMRLVCGRGTYARTFAEDLAKRLGTVGHLVGLRRAQSGGATLQQAVDMRRLAELVAEAPPADLAGGAVGEEGWRAVLRSARGTPRLPWRSPEARWPDIAPLLLSPTEVMPQLAILDLDDREAQRLLRSGLLPTPDWRRERPIGDGARFWVRHAGQILALGEQLDGMRRALRVMPPEG